MGILWSPAQKLFKHVKRHAAADTLTPRRAQLSESKIKNHVRLFPTAYCLCASLPHARLLSKPWCREPRCQGHHCLHVFSTLPSNERGFQFQLRRKMLFGFFCF